MSDAPAPETQAPQPLAMPPEIMLGMQRASQIARARNGIAAVTRRNPDTEQWWVLVETIDGGDAWCVVSYDLQPDATPRAEGWHTTRPEAEQALEALASGQTPIPGAPERPVPPPLTGTALDALKATLTRGIDAAAENARLCYITPGTGQAMVYLAKEQEAKAVLALEGPPPGGLFQLLEADVAVGLAESVLAAAQQVATLATQWRMVAAAIEAIRLGAKAAITDATDEAGARAAAQVHWP